MDTSQFPQAITFTAHITDDLSGLGQISVSFNAPTSPQRLGVYFTPYDRVSGDARDGPYQRQFTLPAYSEHGVWNIGGAYIADQLGNYKYLTANDFVGAGFAASFFNGPGTPPTSTPTPTFTATPTMTTTPLSGSDTTPPQLVAFDFTPNQVNTSQFAQTITFTAHITDDLSGFGQFYLSFDAPTTRQTLSAYFSPYDRVSGDARDGIYQVEVTAPAYSEQGVWQVDWGSLGDQLGNSKTFSAGQFVALGFPASFFNGVGTPPTSTSTPTVTATPTATATATVTTTPPSGSDTTPPQLLAFGFSPKSVDTTHLPQTITFTAHITDDFSGLNWACALFHSEQSTQQGGACFSDYSRLAGSANDGTYSGTTMLPAFAAYGVWSLVSITLGDVLGNSVVVDNAQAQSWGFPTYFVNGPPGYDSDHDGIPDTVDNCPLAANLDQKNTDAANTAANHPGADGLGDACDLSIAGDGYTNAQHTTLGKDPLKYCSIMRADVDGDGAVSILDLTKVAQYFTRSVPPAPERYEQTAANSISILDLTRMAQVFTQHVTSCP